MMEEQCLDYVLVPMGMLVLGIYHSWLLFTIHKYPRRTVIGINADSRHQWVHAIMTDPLKNGVLAVQTMRNNIMASTLLATTAITLSSLISVFVSSTSNSGNTASQILYGNKSSIVSSIKYFSILLCFLVAFLCNVQSIRYYAHVSFLATVPTSVGKKDSIEYVARNLNREVSSGPSDCELSIYRSLYFYGSSGQCPCLCAAARCHWFFISWIRLLVLPGICTITLSERK
ncbi:hypothetical protein P3X46_017071 [Hevea brasiliensis]|uniref:PGG domain-containing protein n=1 Tax=Hevea brasiliensis TaxID=3981 RepID=A0ABQ9M524_HEVBR|nr:hypothetical protein P3X46_017071 [Hevea brasiliensis]